MSKPRFATSYSGIQQYLTCPLQWAASKYYKTLPYIETPERKKGNDFHTALDHYMKGEATEEERALVEPYKVWPDMILSSGATLHIEHEMCFTKDLTPCGWKDWDTVWFRAKADVLGVKGRKVTICDWKTGKVSHDIFQLEVMLACASLLFPEAEHFNGRLIFPLHNVSTGLPATLTRQDMSHVWERIHRITEEMERAWEAERFPPRKSGLCKNYCGYTTCYHCGK